MLDRIDRIEIRHRPGAVPDENAPQGLLLAGWLAARLGWQIDAQRTGTIAGEVPLKNAATGHSINLKFETIEEEGSLEGRMSAINLASQAQDAEFSVELRNDDTKLSTEARIGSMRTVGRVVRYESRSDAERLSNELSFLTHDAVYEDAVRSAAQIMTALR